MYSVDSVEMRPASGEDIVDTVTTRTDFARDHTLTSASELTIESATTVDSALSSLPVTSSPRSVVIGRAEQVPAASQTEVVDATQSADSGPHITTASDGSVVLTLSYSPLKLEPLHRSATADTVVLSRTPDRPSDNHVNGSAVPTDSATENLLSQRYVTSLSSLACIMFLLFFTFCIIKLRAVGCFVVIVLTCWNLF